MVWRHPSQDENLSCRDERLDYALEGASCSVFWTGLPRESVQRWADQNELQTLVRAMGALFSDRDIGIARYGKPPKTGSKNMESGFWSICRICMSYLDAIELVYENVPIDIPSIETFD